MSNFEETIRKGSLSSGKNDPKATDLDYYSKPENYTGASLQSFQRFTTDKNKEERDNKKDEKKRVVKDAKYYFFNRYKHLLKDVIFLEDLLDREQEEESEESECEDDQEGDKASGKVDVGKDGLGKDDRKSNCDGLVTIKEEDDDDDGGDSIRDTPLSFGNLEDRSMSPDSYGSRTPSKKKMSTTRTTSGRQSMGVQRVQMDKMAREIRMKEVKESFVRAVKCVKAICRLSASARGKNTGGDMGQMRTFMDIATDETNTEENMKNAGLSFDPTFFKAKKEISISTDTKNILTTPSELRTPDQVQTAMFGLQTLRSYAEYPLHMQEKLAKVAWYEIVAPKRIIIRQGHFAENFYFILSGNAYVVRKGTFNTFQKVEYLTNNCVSDAVVAVVTILLKDPKTGASFVKTATVMKKGMSFGELALLHHSKRTATVTSQDTVQLLSIGREDFFDIFMASSDGPDALPDHVKFISNLDFMKDWPIHELVENPQHCLLHFFKRNTTIVANSNNSEWIYIVKSGSCQVLKKLKGVIPNCNFVSKPKLDNDEYSPAKMKAIVFAPKVDTGLRKRKSSSAGDGESNPNENETSDGPESKQGNSSNFSKEKYSQNPTTKKAHFSVENSFNRRKHYEPPKKCKPKKTEPVTPAAVSTKPGPVFVQVSTLKPRDVFGIDSVQFDDDIKRFYTSVSLVSSGAELIMLSKDFYAKHATECVKKHIREAVRPYPDEDVFQDNLQIKEDWVMFKQVILSDLTSRIKEVSNRFKS